MTDILERLRSAKPDIDGPPPSIEPVWAQIDQPEPRHDAPRRSWASTKRRRSRRRVTISSVLVLGGVAALVVALTYNGGNGTVARAYAATNTDGVLVHYVEDIVYRPAADSGASYQSMHTVAQIWVSGVDRHLIGANQFLSRGRRVGAFEQEIVANGSRIDEYQGANTIFETRETVTGPCTPTACRGVPVDPVAQLHHLSVSRALTAAGETTFDGRRVAVLKSHGGLAGDIRVLVDPQSGVPLQISQTYGSKPWPASPTATTTITNFQRLPLTAHTRQLLAMHPHPGARVIHEPQAVVVGKPSRVRPPTRGRVVKQIPLSPPDHRTPAVGTVVITRSGASLYLRMTAARIAHPPVHSSYAAWLIGNSGRAKLLGFINPGPDHHQRMSTEGRLPADSAHYNEILITVESRPRPSRPGKAILRGRGSF